MKHITSCLTLTTFLASMSIHAYTVYDGFKTGAGAGEYQLNAPLQDTINGGSGFVSNSWHWWGHTTYLRYWQGTNIGLGYSDGFNTLATTPGAAVIPSGPGWSHCERTMPPYTNGIPLWFSYISDRRDESDINAWDVSFIDSGGSPQAGQTRVAIRSSDSATFSYYCNFAGGGETNIDSGTSVHGAHFIVGHVSKMGSGGAVTRIWVDPSNIADIQSVTPDILCTNLEFMGGIDRIDLYASGNRDGAFDEIRCGTNLSAVIELAPVPAGHVSPVENISDTGSTESPYTFISLTNGFASGILRLSITNADATGLTLTRTDGSTHFTATGLDSVISNGLSDDFTVEYTGSGLLNENAEFEITGDAGLVPITFSVKGMTGELQYIFYEGFQTGSAQNEFPVDVIISNTSWSGTGWQSERWILNENTNVRSWVGSDLDYTYSDGFLELDTTPGCAFITNAAGSVRASRSLAPFNMNTTLWFSVVSARGDDDDANQWNFYISENNTTRVGVYSSDFSEWELYYNGYGVAATSIWTGVSAWETNFIIGYVTHVGSGTANTEAKIWINPPDLSAPTNTSPAAVSDGTFQVNILDTINFYAAGNRYGAFDEIRVGTTLDDVVHVIPEPCAILVYMLLSIWIVRRHI